MPATASSDGGFAPRNVTAVTPASAYGAPGTTTVLPALQMDVQKFGRTTGHTMGSIGETNVTVDVCYETRGPVRCTKLARFTGQFTVSGGSFSTGGDSGSLIVTDNAGKNPVGLLFAGSSTRTIANPIDPVLTRFGMTITTDPGSGTGNPPPTAAFTSDCTGLTCTFNGSGSSDDGTITSYSWTFGDGQIGSGAVDSNTYAAGGTFDVTLTVTDNLNAQGSTTQSVTVNAPGAFTLSTSGTKVRGSKTAELSWSGASGTSVDIVRGGNIVATTANDGSYTDNIGRGGGSTFVYQVCEAGTSTCSNTSTVVF